MAIASGSDSERQIANQYGVTQAAVHRHKDHVLAAIRKTVERHQTERVREVTSVWKERLEQAYGLAEGGTRAAAQDEKNWPAGARFLAVMAKLIETGLEVDGVIGPAAQNTVVTTCEQVLILPVKRSIESTCEAIEE